MEKERFRSSAAYPPVQVSGKNLDYAREILENIGSPESEMSTISLYIYNSLVTADEFREVSECFHGLAVVEMRHLEIFSRLVKLLGVQPRLWCQRTYRKRGFGSGLFMNSSVSNRMVWWSPSYNTYHCELRPMLTDAIKGEEAAIRQYRRQAEMIQDTCICEVLKRIILDEERHIEVLRDLYEKYVECRCREPEIEKEKNEENDDCQ